MLAEILDYLRRCYMCGGLPANGSIFCPRCESKFEQNISGKWRSSNDLSHFYLFSLGGDFGRFLNAMVVDLKDRDYPKLLELLVQSFLRIGHKSPALFVPAPSRSARGHAQRLAAKLSDATGFKNLDCLEVTDASKGMQKLHGRTERFKSELRLKQTIGTDQISGPIILVDDVLTTGATALAAYKALGQPKEFKIWTLGYQPLLR